MSRTLQLLWNCLWAGLRGDAYPVTYKHKSCFNGTAMAPEIGFIKRYSDTVIQSYQKHIPGSEAASDYLLQISNECKELIKQLLLTPTQRDEFNIEFFTGTSRAVEVALAGIFGPKKIILSPFEHPTVAEVTKWYTSIDGSNVYQICFGSADFFRNWQEQESKFIDQLMSKVPHDTKTSVLILSEVSYATGMVIPLEGFIKRIRNLWDKSTLKIIIDGAHSVGNGRRLYVLDECDVYIYSAHKWLLAPEPCGIMLSRQETSRKLTSYDSWSNTLPLTTVSARTIAGLLGSLKFLERVGLEKLWSHSWELRRSLLERTQSKFMMVGENNGMEASLMVAVCPKPGFRWIYNLQELRAYLQKNSVYVLVLAIDPTIPWIRVAFQYFIKARQLNLLCAVLETTVVSQEE